MDSSRLPGKGPGRKGGGRGGRPPTCVIKRPVKKLKYFRVKLHGGSIMAGLK